MKELVVLSGKGGTGKTAVTAAFAHLASADENCPQTVIVDADVDAANLALVVGSDSSAGTEFVGGDVAFIDQGSCLVCGICQECCRFDAISFSATEGFRVDLLGCEGCGACLYQCPSESIEMVPRVSGHWFRSESRFGPLFHARLLPAQEASGKLVTLVKEKAREEGSPSNLLLVDGPPGIACPAIAAVTGADLVLIVTEPTVAGLHDLKRTVGMASHFRLPTLVCINKADLHPDGSHEIEEYCRTAEARLLGRIPFDEGVTKAMVQGVPVTDCYPDGPAARALQGLWQEVRDTLLGSPHSDAQTKALRFPP